jgi:hypothetical protein
MSEQTGSVLHVAGTLPVMEGVCLVRHYAGAGAEAAHGLSGHPGLALAHVALAEEELAVQVAGLDGVHVDLHQVVIGLSSSVEKVR